MNKIKIALFTFILLPFITYGQKVNKTDAIIVAEKVYKKNNQGKDVKLEKVIVLDDIKTKDTLLYIVPFEKSGFVIVSAHYSIQPVLGYCMKGDFNPEITPPGLLYLIDKYKYSITEAINKKTKPSKKIKNLWEEYLEDNLFKSYTVGTFLLDTEWGQQSNFNQYCPSSYPAGCTALAMAQILRYWECRNNPTGSITYASTSWEGGSANFGTSTYNWLDMNDTYADNDNALLIYHAGVSCLTHYKAGGSTSTPGRARDGFVDIWGISSDADVKWRIFHLSNWQDMLENELDLERPILYSAGGFEIGDDWAYGHSWVIDGYNSSNEFHCNWGWYGSYNGWFSLGGFEDFEGDGLNQIESAIFNVVPEQPDGVAQPQLNAQVFIYNPNGYTITIPEAFGASSYEWTTSHGTITGTGTSVTLETGCSATVQVRAFNDQCDIYSSYDSELITIEYPPISGSSTVCTSGSTFTLNIAPEATINWTHSNNLSYVSGQGTANYTVNAISNSIGIPDIITATISNVSCQDVVIQKEVYSSPDFSDFDIEVPVSPVNGNYDFVVWASGLPAQITNYNWAVGNGYIVSQDLNEIIIHPTSCTLDPRQRPVTINVTANNTCGSASAYTFVPVDCDGGGINPLSVQPNPANNYIDVEIIDIDPEIDNNELQIKLFNYRSTPVYMGNSHQKSFRISTNHLPRGLYILQVIYNGKQYSKQVLIEH